MKSVAVNQRIEMELMARSINNCDSVLSTKRVKHLLRMEILQVAQEHTWLGSACQCYTGFEQRGYLTYRTTWTIPKEIPKKTLRPATNDENENLMLKSVC